LYRSRAYGYTSAPMRIDSPSAQQRSETSRGFEAIADTIMYRWSVERDTWVSTNEVAQAREYLARAGVTTNALPDGRFVLAGQTASAFGAARLVLLGLRHLQAARKSPSRP
jgi:hypothetical protein